MNASAGNPGSGLTAAQSQAQLQSGQRTGIPVPPRVAVRVLRIPPGRKRHLSDVPRAGIPPGATRRLLQAPEEEEEIHAELHGVALRPRAVPEGGERQQGYGPGRRFVVLV